MPEWTPELESFLDSVTEADFEAAHDVTFLPADMFEGLLYPMEDR